MPRHTCFVLTCLLSLSAVSTAAEPERVRLYVSGAFCAGCAEELRSSLVEGGAKNPSKVAPNRGKGHVIIVAEYAHDADLSPLAKAVVDAETPHRDQSKPGLAVELLAKLDDKTATAAKEVLAKLSGVDAKGSLVDTQRGALSVRLTGQGKVTTAGIIAELKKAGIEARVDAGPVQPAPNKPVEREVKKKR